MKNLASAALLLLSMVLTPHLAQAATYCVDKTIDGAPDHTRCSAACAGTCSLRDAITAVDIVGGTTTISIRPGTYTIGGTTADRGEDTNLVGDYDITNVDPLIIEGDGALTTIIDGGGIDRVFHVLQTSAAKVTIRDLTVTNGDPGANGGGLAVESEAAFERLVVKSNSSVGIGGGIAYTGGESISLASSSVFDNFTTGDGGGIGRFGGAPVGDFRATNVTIAGNRADGAGGGMIAAQVFLKNVTIFGNTADDDGSNGALEDGGGIYALVGVDVRNSIIAGNTDASTGGGATVHSDCLGTIDSSAFTLYGKNTGCTITVSSNDQVGTGASPIDPFLDSVLDIFGGETPVLRLKNGSTAVNAGDPAGCKASDGVTNLTEDQRGFTRPVGGRCDLGAYEKGGCGDGAEDFEETCDDGNASNTDACINTCEAASCGDGFVRAGVEACDDGNSVDTDACKNTCALATCGNGAVDAGEECDDGAGNSNTAADACRVACLNPSCGDSVVDSGEECDDGNIADGDGCSSLCADEGDEDDDKGGGGCSLIR